MNHFTRAYDICAAQQKVAGNLRMTKCGSTKNGTFRKWNFFWMF